MPALSKIEAAEKLAKVVEKAKPSELAEIYAELFPEKPTGSPPIASNMARHIRTLNHDEALKAAAKTELLLSAGAKRILRAMAR
jgi:hypothetical protein